MGGFKMSKKVEEVVEEIETFDPTEVVKKPFNPSMIPMMGNNVSKEWITVPEWRIMDKDGNIISDGSVCVWGTTQKNIISIENDVRLSPDNDLVAAARRQIATIIECCKDGDGADAKPIFTRTKSWGWLEEQPSAVLDRITRTVAELDLSGPLRIKDVMDFFLTVENLQGCLRHIGSVCGSCTDCHQKSQGTCPLQSLTQLSSQTAQ